MNYRRVYQSDEDYKEKEQNALSLLANLDSMNGSGVNANFFSEFMQAPPASSQYFPSGMGPTPNYQITPQNKSSIKRTGHQIAYQPMRSPKFDEGVSLETNESIDHYPPGKQKSEDRKIKGLMIQALSKMATDDRNVVEGGTSKLFHALQNQNEMIRKLKYEVDDGNYKKLFSEERDKYERKIYQLENLLERGQDMQKGGDGHIEARKPLPIDLKDLALIPKNAHESNKFFSQASRNPFYNQQVRINDQLMGWIDKLSEELTSLQEENKVAKEQLAEALEAATRSRRHRGINGSINSIEENSQDQSMDEEKMKEIALQESRTNGRLAFLRRKFKGHVFLRIFLRTFDKEVNKLAMERRQEAFEYYRNSLPVIIDEAKATFSNGLKGTLQSLFAFMKKNQLHVIPFKGKLASYKKVSSPNQKTILKRIPVLVTKTKELLKAIKEGCSELSPHVQYFLAYVSMERSFLPIGFHFEFEIERLNFNVFSATKKSSSSKTQMLCACFLIFQVLLPIVLKIPAAQNQKNGISDEERVSLRTINSVIFHLFIDFLRKEVPLQKSNQLHLPTNLKIKPRTGPIKMDPSLPEIKKSPSGNKELEVIEDVFEKSDMEILFVTNAKQLEPLREIVKEIMEGFSQTIEPMRMKLLWGNIVIRFEQMKKAYALCVNKGWYPPKPKEAKD